MVANLQAAVTRLQGMSSFKIRPKWETFLLVLCTDTNPKWVPYLPLKSVSLSLLFFSLPLFFSHLWAAQRHFWTFYIILKKNLVWNYYVLTKNCVTFLPCFYELHCGMDVHRSEKKKRKKNLPYAQALRKPTTASRRAKIHTAGKKWFCERQNGRSKCEEGSFCYCNAPPTPPTLVVFLSLPLWQLLEPPPSPLPPPKKKNSVSLWAFQKQHCHFSSSFFLKQTEEKTTFFSLPTPHNGPA